MNWRSKKTLSVTFAILIGVGIIFFAWRSGNPTHTEVSPMGDNGAWKDSLSVVPQGASSKTLVSAGAQGNTSSTDTLSTTGAVAQEMMINYMSAKSNSKSTSTMSDSEAQNFASGLIKNNVGAPIKQYTSKDIVIVDASTSTVNLYKKEVSEVMKTFINNNSFNELSVVARALNTNDGTKLEPLTIAVSNYQKLIKALLLIKVPRTEETFHLYTTQSYATILSGVIDMQGIIDDPVRGTQGFAKYNNGVTMLLQTETLFNQNK